MRSYDFSINLKQSSILRKKHRENEIGHGMVLTVHTGGRG
jgi:hypothetical protein